MISLIDTFAVNGIILLKRNRQFTKKQYEQPQNLLDINLLRKLKVQKMNFSSENYLTNTIKITAITLALMISANLPPLLVFKLNPMSLKQSMRESIKINQAIYSLKNLRNSSSTIPILIDSNRLYYLQ